MIEVIIQPKPGNIETKRFELIKGTYQQRNGCGSFPNLCGYSELSDPNRDILALRMCLLSRGGVIWCGAPSLDAPKDSEEG